MQPWHSAWKAGILIAMNVLPITAPGIVAKRVHRQVVLTRSQAWEIRQAFLGFLISMPSFFRSDSSRVDFIFLSTRGTVPGSRRSPVRTPGCV